MLIYGSALLPLMIPRLTGEDGHSDSFSFNFYSGTDPGSITGEPRTGLLAGYDAAAPWASTLYSTSLYLPGPITLTASATGSATFAELLAYKDATPARLLHCSVRQFPANLNPMLLSIVSRRKIFGSGLLHIRRHHIRMLSK